MKFAEMKFLADENLHPEAIKFISIQKINIGIIYLRLGHIISGKAIASLKKLIEASLDFQSPFIAVVENKSGEIHIRLRNKIYGQ